MTTREIKVISETDIAAFEKKVADYIAENPVEEMKFSTADTAEGIVYSVMLSVISKDSSAQV